MPAPRRTAGLTSRWSTCLGSTITDYCDKHRLSTRARLELFVQVCGAVQHAHQKGIIHRDIKPSNILVTLQDGKPVPKVIDFGVAKATHQRLTEKTLFTEFGHADRHARVHEPRAGGDERPGHRHATDIYSLGVLLYELLVGAPALRSGGYGRPATAKSSGSSAKRNRSAQYRLSGLGGSRRRGQAPAHGPPPARDLRGDLDWITMKAMEKDRTRRYPSASELGTDVRRHLNDEAVVARPPSLAYRVHKFGHRHRAAVLAGAAMLTTVLAGFIISTYLLRSGGRSTRDRSPATRSPAASLHCQPYSCRFEPALWSIPRSPPSVTHDGAYAPWVGVAVSGPTGPTPVSSRLVPGARFEAFPTAPLSPSPPTGSGSSGIPKKRSTCGTRLRPATWRFMVVSATSRRWRPAEPPCS